MTNFYKDKKNIINWLDKYKVKNYTLILDEKYGFVVDVNGDVYLNSKNLTFIPVKFNKINGGFYCGDNQLTSLEFSPKVVNGSFDCSYNKLASLEFCPQAIGDSFYCSYNKLASLEFCPQTAEGSFNCSNNQLASLEFFSQEVGGNFYCYKNPKLKEIQKITDFKQIYLEHKKILINKFSDKLENQLLSDSTKKSTKIKI